MRVDLPLPETPVTQVKVPSGIAASTFCRLFSLAPRILIAWPGCPSRRMRGTSIWRSPVRYWPVRLRSEEHTSELQSLMRISYAVFCLKKKKNTIHKLYDKHHINARKSTST